MDYDFGNLQEEIEYQNLQNKEQAQDQGQMLADFLEMSNETTIEEESKTEGRGELYELGQLRQVGFLPAGV